MEKNSTDAIDKQFAHLSPQQRLILYKETAEEILNEKDSELSAVVIDYDKIEELEDMADIFLVKIEKLEKAGVKLPDKSPIKK